MTREAKLVGVVLGLVGGFIVTVATAATWMVSAGAPPKLRILFRVMCHGIEERCLSLWGSPMPICSRCVAIYGGLAIGVLAFAAIGWLRTNPIGLRGLCLLIIPLAVDGITQAAGVRESTNELRLLTGILAGGGFAIWSLGTVETSVRERLKVLKFEMLTREKA
jgi:uncharacterized membrane protein